VDLHILTTDIAMVCLDCSGWHPGLLLMFMVISKDPSVGAEGAGLIRGIIGAEAGAGLKMGSFKPRISSRCGHIKRRPSTIALISGYQ